MAQSRGATEPMLIAQPYPVVGLGAAPRRSRARPVSGEPEADTLRAALDPLLKEDQAEAAEALMLQSMPLLSYEARAEASQRVAFTYYAINRDADARRVAVYLAEFSAVSEWAAHFAWVSGLAIRPVSEQPVLACIMGRQKGMMSVESNPNWIIPASDNGSFFVLIIARMIRNIVHARPNPIPTFDKTHCLSVGGRRAYSEGAVHCQV